MAFIRPILWPADIDSLPDHEERSSWLLIWYPNVFTGDNSSSLGHGARGLAHERSRSWCATSKGKSAFEIPILV